MGSEIALRALVGVPVRAGNLTIGAVQDVVLARTFGHALGILVSRGDGREAFVPWIGISVHSHSVTVSSRELVLPSRRAAHHRWGTCLSELLAPPSEDGKSRFGDVLVTEDGDVTAIMRVSGAQTRPSRPARVLVTLTAKRDAAAAAESA